MIERLLRYAVLAPSKYNAQPWTFRVLENAIEVHADYTRRLIVSDPNDREMFLSIGAAIANLRVAAAQYGYESSVDYDAEETRVALVNLRETLNPDVQLRALFQSITRRHTNRIAFERREIDPDALERVCDFVDGSDTLNFLIPHERVRAAELVEQGDLQLMSNDAWRHELADWIRPNDEGSPDGMRGESYGIPGPLGAFASSLVRSIDAGRVRGRRDRELTEQAAGIIIVSSEDDRVPLLRAGEALELLLLLLTSLDIQYAFLNQPIEVPQLRRELWNLVRTPRPPQLMLRIGYASPVRHAAPRRPLEAVMH